MVDGSIDWLLQERYGIVFAVHLAKWLPFGAFCGHHETDFSLSLNGSWQRRSFRRFQRVQTFC